LFTIVIFIIFWRSYKVSKATETREYIRTWPVNYDDIYITGEDPKQIFAKDMETGEVQLLDCTVIVSPDFPICIVNEIEPIRSLPR
jgi:hypothetical protein